MVRGTGLSHRLRWRPSLPRTCTGPTSAPTEALMTGLLSCLAHIGAPSHAAALVPVRGVGFAGHFRGLCEGKRADLAVNGQLVF